MTDGIVAASKGGPAQGSITSLVIANVYMHNALILWYKFVVLNGIKGDSLIAYIFYRFYKYYLILLKY